MEILQTQPSALSGRFLQQVKSELHLTLSHGNLYEQRTDVDRRSRGKLYFSVFLFANGLYG